MSTKLPFLVAVATLCLTPTLFADTNVPMPVITMDPAPVTLIYVVPGQAQPVELQNLQLTNPSSTTPITPTTLKFPINSFFDIFTEISLDGGSTFLPAVQSQGAHVAISDTNIGTSNGTTTFTTEMYQLDIPSLPGFPGLELRESPTLVSTGQTTLTDNGDGTFRVSSFFDVFTELSLDGGQTWTPATSSARLTGSPEPASLALLSLATLPLLLGKRRA